MKNAYSDLEQVLEHCGCTFDDVIVENVFTTGTWLEIKGLALPEFMIEIELEAHQSR